MHWYYFLARCSLFETGWVVDLCCSFFGGFGHGGAFLSLCLFPFLVLGGCSCCFVCVLACLMIGFRVYGFAFVFGVFV